MKKLILTLTMTLLVSGCGAWAAQTPVPKAPKTPNAIVTNSELCITHEEAGELLKWIVYVEENAVIKQ